MAFQPSPLGELLDMRWSTYGPNARPSNSSALATRSRLLIAIDAQPRKGALTIRFSRGHPSDIQPRGRQRVVRAGFLRPLLGLGDLEQPVRKIAGSISQPAHSR